MINKLKSLSAFLSSENLYNESRAVDVLTKESVLKRRKRKTGGKGKEDRMEWGLFSKSNPKKVLKWFGPKKPSKEEVAKEERRVHSFANYNIKQMEIKNGIFKKSNRSL
jgi:hypothetical protein